MENLPSSEAITGLSLVNKLKEVRKEREALIEGLLYEHSIIMISSDPGAGKSVLIANIIARLSMGFRVFDQLYCPKERICYYIPFERGAEEILERLKHLQSYTAMAYDNIFINENFIGLNVIDTRHADHIIETISKDCKPDLIILDPIYASVSGGLSTDDKASQFCRFSARLQHTFGCSIWLNHHTVKDTYSSFNGEKIGKSDPFYGSQWLKAHVTASYHMKRNHDDTGIILDKKKDSFGNLIEKIELGFNAEDYSLFSKESDTEDSKKDRFYRFLRASKANKKPFTFNDLKGVYKGVSTSYLRRLLCTPEVDTSIKKHKSNGGATLYEVIGDF